MSLNKTFRYYKEYGLKCTIIMAIYHLFQHADNDSYIKRGIVQLKHSVICNYLKSHYYNVAISERKDSSINNGYSQCIWTAWLQGEENAPEVICLTISSIRKHSGNHQVIVITDDNVDSFISIPQIIKKKHADGIIGHSHYADIIRMMILAQYGGVWVDATTFLCKSIDEKAFVSPFYSIGFNSEKSTIYVSNLKWIVGHIGGCKDSKYLSIISSMLVSYWEEHDVLIDYFVFDYFIALLYYNDELFHSIVDNLGKNVKFTYELNRIMDEPLNKTVLDNLLLSNNIFILSHRQKHQRQTPEGLMTNYGYLYDQYLGE